MDTFFLNEEEYLQNLDADETPNFEKANRQAEQEAAKQLSKDTKKNDKAINFNLKREAKEKETKGKEKWK